MKKRQPEPVPAWQLTEGAVLPDQIMVIAVRRDPVSRTVHVVTDEGGWRELAADEPVPVVTRLH